MKSRQKQAIRNLEKALERCERNGVVVMSMDDQLIAYDRERLKTLEDKEGDLYKAQRRMSELLEDEPIDHHDAYLDSGGW